jgi:heme/copper-type cytochrome/quinol oxidase subunit 1
MSTNHKDIGTLYMIFGSFAGVMGTLLCIFTQPPLANLGVLRSGEYENFSYLLCGILHTWR